MKVNTISIAILFASALLWICPCVGQSNVIYYGVATNSMRVVFADTNLAASVCTSIVTDLQMCLLVWGKQSELDLGAYDVGLVGYLYNPDKCPHYPEGFRFPRNLITNQTGALALQIPKALSDAYTNAFSFAAANSNIVAAAYEFVTFVSSSNFVSSVTSNTVCNYILVKGVTNEYYRTEFSGIVDGIFQYPKYYPPSLLGFYCSTNGPGTNNLYFRLPAKTNPGYGYDEWHGVPAVWHDNKWKVCIGYEWEP